MKDTCKTCGQDLPPPTLKRLIAREGAEAIAALLGVTRGSLLNMRSTQRPMRLLSLYQLKAAFPDFDVEGTVMEMGPRREAVIAKKAAKDGGS